MVSDQKSCFKVIQDVLQSIGIHVLLITNINELFMSLLYILKQLSDCQACETKTGIPFEEDTDQKSSENKIENLK